MKKFIFMIVTLFTVTFAANAQIATENQKFFDNVYVGVEGGVSTPLDFNSMFPLNSMAGLKLGKEFTPVFGLEAEGIVFFNENNFNRWTDTFVKGTNVSLNGVVNLMNLFAGYKSSPRVFEIKTNTGLGWAHLWNTSTNTLTAKTALDLDFNLGKNKAHTFYLSPGVYWNLHNDKIQFNKKEAQLAVMIGYVYHFKTSNKTHHFKTYDVGAMANELDKLATENETLSKKAKLMPTTNAVATSSTAATPEVKVVKEIKYVNNTRLVTFAKNSCELDSVAKAELDKVEGMVDIYAYASPEGSEEYNKILSQKRADVVAAYLKNRGVEVRSAVGKGVVGISSNRIAIVQNVEPEPNK